MIYCSDADWHRQASQFRAIADRYPGQLLSSRKMKGSEQRVMEYEFEDANDAELLMQECMTLEGFTATFESA